MLRTNSTPGMLKGQKWRQTHQATVDAILGPKVRIVQSRGSQFFNSDNWPARRFASALTEWARLNPSLKPTEEEARSWVRYANIEEVAFHEKRICIASTPDELPRGLAFALVGGGYHEAWHTEYSRRKPLHLHEVWPKLSELWDLIPYDPTNGKHGWAGLVGPLLTWSNIVEDIRIERCGCRKYPGAQEKMEALQDLILKMEEEGKAAADHRGIPTNDDLSVVVGAFRDIGLDYNTPRQKTALQGYKERSPAGWRFVTAGALKPLLDAAMALGPKDDMDSMWLAMRIVAKISEVAKTVAVKVPGPKKGKKEAPAPAPPPLPSMGETEESDDGEPDEDAGPAQGADSKPAKEVWKVGDRATPNTGPFTGREVEITRASLPDENGDQDLEWALVEEDSDAA